jgi:hypothetical protein
MLLPCPFPSSHFPCLKTNSQTKLACSTNMPSSCAFHSSSTIPQHLTHSTNLSKTNVPNMQPEDQDEPHQLEFNNEPTSEQAQFQQPSYTPAPVPAPTTARRIPARRVRARRSLIPRTDNERYNLRAVPTKTVLSPIRAGVTKKTTPRWKSVRKTRRTHPSQQ